MSPIGAGVSVLLRLDRGKLTGCMQLRIMIKTRRGTSFGARVTLIVGGVSDDEVPLRGGVNHTLQHIQPKYLDEMHKL